MTSDSELISCPGSCGNKVHFRATECPRCGYRPEGARAEDLLGSLGLISSILVGFGMEALIAMAGGKEEFTDSILLQWTFAVWMVSSVLLLVAMVLAEAIRRRGSGVNDIRASSETADKIRQRCRRLLIIFTTALLITTAGIVLLSFVFAPWHGILAIAAVVAGFLLIFWALD